MKNQLISAYLIYFLIIAGFIGIFIVKSDNNNFVSGNSIIVDCNGGGNYTKIQDAINNANPGDIIYVWSGIYNEDIIVNKTLTLIGNGSKNTTIKGTGTDSVVIITADWVNISGFTIINSWEWFSGGIELYNVQNCHIENNNCSNNNHGILLYLSENNSIVSNICYLNKDDGISIWYSNNNKIENNILLSNLHNGIQLEDSSNNIIQNNNFLFNIGNGLTLLSFSKNNIIKNNNCYSNLASGIGISNPSTKNIIEKNRCYNNEVGITLWNSSHNMILGNNNSNNNYGIYFYFADNNTIKNNNCSSNKKQGIWLDYSNHNEIKNNKCSNNKYGIFINYSNNNKINTNMISYNKNGVKIQLSSFKNEIYHNNIINNTIQANDTCTNYWDDGYPSGGNHWSDYLGIDIKKGVNQDQAGGDGIGDTPYLINGDSNQDNYPLVNPWLTIPSPPLNFKAITGDKYINLFWDKPSDNGSTTINEYKIYRGIKSNSLTYFNSVDGLSFNYNDTTVINGQQYFYYITAVNIVGESKPSNIINITSLGFPNAPEDLEIKAGNKYINLTWQPPIQNGGSEIIKYKIYRGNENNEEIYLNYVNGTILNFNDTSVINGKRYYYYVTAVNNIGESKPSSEINATPLSPPDSPQALHALVGDNYVNITWQIPDDDGGTSIIEYKIYRSQEQNIKIYLDNVTETILYYNDTSVINGEKYFYYLTAINIIGESKPSNVVNVTPLGLPGPSEELKVRWGNKYINLTWGSPSDTGGIKIKEYKVYKGTKSGGEIYLIFVNGTKLYFNDTSVINGKKYFYFITTVNIVGESGQSNEVNATPSWIPNVPFNLKTIAGDNYINLTWQGPNDNGGTEIIEFKIYRKNEQNNYIHLNSVDNSTFYYNDTSVINGDKYYYYITAVNIIGESRPSIEVNITPLSIPGPPQNLQAITGDSYITLTWQPPTYIGGSAIIEYKIYRILSSNNETYVYRVDAFKNFYNDTQVSNRETYFYFVTAFNNVGESESSNIINATPQRIERDINKQKEFGNIIITIILIIIILIISIIIILLVLKKRSTREKQTIIKTGIIKPTDSSILVKTQEKTSVTPTVSQPSNTNQVPGSNIQTYMSTPQQINQNLQKSQLPTDQKQLTEIKSEKPTMYNQNQIQ